jgi:hypothetical protein
VLAVDGIAFLISNTLAEGGVAFWIAVVLFYVLVWGLLVWRGVSVVYMLVLPIGALVAYLVLIAMRETQLVQHAPSAQDALYYSLAFGAVLQAFGDLLWNIAKAIVRLLSTSSRSESD